MKTEQLQELVKTNTTDDGINFDAINKSINEETNMIRDNAVAKYKETAIADLKDEINTEFIKGYGYDNIDQFSAFVKNSKASTNELTEKVTRYEGELTASKTSYAELEKKYNALNTENSAFKNGQAARKAGVKEDMVDYAIYEANKLVSDDKDFDAALKEVLEAKPNLKGEAKRMQKVGKEAGKTKAEDSSVSDKMAKKYPWLKK